MVSVVFRRIASDAEYAACDALQRAVWGHHFADRVPVSILRIGPMIGGVTAGAFTEKQELLGFVFGLTGVRNGRLLHWSDMLAVAPHARDRGIGTRLKCYQRTLAREAGATAMRWSFDPLVARNAHVNLHHLGARVTEYVRDMYGTHTGSALHDTIGTDRVIAEWDLEAPDPVPGTPARYTGPVVNDAPEPCGEPAAGPLPDAACVGIAIPADVHAVLATAPDVARRWRETTRYAFEHYVGRGYRVAGIQRAAARAHSVYTLVAPA